MRCFGEGNPTLRLYLKQTDWAEIALPSVVVAEVMRGRCEFALKAPLANAPSAHRLLMETQALLKHFKVVVFDENCVIQMEYLKQKHKTHKRYADMTIAATALAGNHNPFTSREI